MKVYICTDHDSHFSIGVASVVVAKDRGHAKRLLDKELIHDGLKPSSEEVYTLEEVKIDKATAIILQDGNY